MSHTRGLLFSAALLATLAGARAASAQELSSLNSDRGRFVFRNDASFLGMGVGAPMTSAGVTSGTLTGAKFNGQFALTPSVDIFVIPNLSIGGALGFGFNNALNADVFTFFVMPRVGYNVQMGSRFSVWPQFGIGIGVVNAQAGFAGKLDAMAPLDLYVPFLFHAVENFFLGVGPGMRFYSLNDKAVLQVVTFDFLRFTLGGSVPVF